TAPASLGPLRDARDRRARRDRGLPAGLRVPGARLPPALRRSLQRPLDVAGLSLDIALGRAGRVAPLVELPAERLHGALRLVGEGQVPRAAAGDAGDAHDGPLLLHRPAALRGEPVRD